MLYVWLMLIFVIVLVINYVKPFSIKPAFYNETNSQCANKWNFPRRKKHVRCKTAKTVIVTINLKIDVIV